MTSASPPSVLAQLFNNGYYTNLSSPLTLKAADSRYLKLTGGILTGALTVSSSLTVSGQTTLQNATTTGLTVSGTSIYTDTQTVNKSSGDLIILNSSDTNGRSTLKLNCSGIDCEIGLRASLASTAPSHYYRYGAGSYRFVQSMLTGNSINYGQLTVNTSSSHLTLVNASETSILEHAASQLKISSSVSSSFLYLNSIGVGINASGSHLTLRNSSNIGFIEQTSSNILRIISGLAVNLDSNGLRIDSIGNTASARGRLDLGDSLSNKTLGIYNNGTAFYGLSANNNLLQFSSNVGFQWYSNCTDSSPINTALMNLGSNGVLTLTENAIMGKGFFVPQSTFSSAGRSGTGTALHHVQTNYSEFFSYTYPSGPMRAIYMCNFAYFNGAGGTLNLNNGINASLYPLSVGGSSSGSIGTYGFLNQSGTTGSTSVNPVPISIYAANRVAATEFNAYSDIRLKKDIEELDDETALLFVKNISPKSFKWKNDETNTPQIGYIAQDILRLKNSKLDYLVGTSEDKGLEKVVDEDGLINPADIRFIVSYQQSAVVLHAVVKNLLARIEDLERIAFKKK